jgi:hypothetical protein
MYRGLVEPSVRLVSHRRPPRRPWQPGRGARPRRPGIRPASASATSQDIVSPYRRRRRASIRRVCISRSLMMTADLDDSVGSEVGREVGRARIPRVFLQRGRAQGSTRQ